MKIRQVFVRNPVSNCDLALLIGKINCRPESLILNEFLIVTLLYRIMSNQIIRTRAKVREKEIDYSKALSIYFNEEELEQQE